MQLRIITRNVDLTPALRQFVERRLGFALGRFAPRVGHLLVRLTDVNLVESFIAGFRLSSFRGEGSTLASRTSGLKRPCTVRRRGSNGG